VREKYCWLVGDKPSEQGVDEGQTIGQASLSKNPAGWGSRTRRAQKPAGDASNAKQ
jgi:hypothetical protein